jgi:hypothetical protein
MDHFISLGCMSSKFGSLNRCRLYMKVIHLSNITLADGKLILPDSKLGNRESLRQSKLDWPTQEKPPPAAWQLWCNALGHFEHNNRLLVPLGDWIHPSHQLWDWFKDAAELFHQKGIEQWEKYQLTPISARPTRTSVIHYSVSSEPIPCDNVPTSLLPATIK